MPHVWGWCRSGLTDPYHCPHICPWQMVVAHMEISTLLTPCSVQGCMQGGNNLVNTMEL